jgi:hypothetical protein
MLLAMLCPFAAAALLAPPKVTTVAAGVPRCKLAMAANGLQRRVLATVANPFVAHEAPLPFLTQRLISDRARLILAFVLEYLEDAGLDVQVYASGGYVRDLLLGSTSEDLDLSLCLARAPTALTVAELAKGLPAFALRRRDLAIEAVEVVSSLSATAVSKEIDAAQVRLTICGEGEPLFVDLLPTIGSEEYDAADRIPRRTAVAVPGTPPTRPLVSPLPCTFLSLTPLFVCSPPTYSAAQPRRTRCAAT